MNIAPQINMMLSGDAMTRLFDLDLQLLQDSALTLIAVFVLFLAGSFFFFKPARKFLENRKKGIADDIESAKKDKEEALKLKEEYAAKLKEADKEVEAILADARKKGIASEEKIIGDAKVEAGRIMENAHHEAELSKQRVVNEVKDEIIDVASVMAGKIVKTGIDDSVKKQLLDETLKEMGDDTWVE